MSKDQREAGVKVIERAALLLVVLAHSAALNPESMAVIHSVKSELKELAGRLAAEEEKL